MAPTVEVMTEVSSWKEEMRKLLRQQKTPLMCRDPESIDYLKTYEVLGMFEHRKEDTTEGVNGGRAELQKKLQQRLKRLRDTNRGCHDDSYIPLSRESGEMKKSFRLIEGAMKKSSTLKAEDVVGLKLLHQSILVYLNNALCPGTDEHENFRTMLAAYLSDGEIKKCQSVSQLLYKLEMKQIISIGNYDKLIEVLRYAGLKKLAADVSESANVIQREITDWKSSNDTEETVLESGNMTLTIKPIRGMEVKLAVDGETTVHGLMLEYQSQSGEEPRYQILIHHGNVMPLDQTMADLNVKDGDTIHKLNLTDLLPIYHSRETAV